MHTEPSAIEFIIHLMWILGNVVGAIAFFAFGLYLYRRAARQVYGYPTCLDCRHNLTGVVGVSEQCPECGLLIKGGRFRSPDALRPSGCLMRMVGGAIVLCFFLGTGIVMVGSGIALLVEAISAQ